MGDSCQRTPSLCWSPNGHCKLLQLQPTQVIPTHTAVHAPLINNRTGHWAHPCSSCSVSSRFEGADTEAVLDCTMRRIPAAATGWRHQATSIGRPTGRPAGRPDRRASPLRASASLVASRSESAATVTIGCNARSSWDRDAYIHRHIVTKDEWCGRGLLVYNVAIST